jgi:hypothetical protein
MTPLDTTTLDFLRGTTFSNGHHFKLYEPGAAPHRNDRLIDLARGKRLLHIGCCDHLPLIREKVASGLYLHQRLCKEAQRCVGVDINADGVELLKELGFPEVYLPPDTPQDDYDLCLLADVIEHVGDVVSFLRSMKAWKFKEIVVVTPNAFRLRNWIGSGEIVNTDHRYWFTPYTLCKVLADAGFEPTAVELLHGDASSWRGRLLARALDPFPKMRDMLLVRARLAA